MNSKGLARLKKLLVKMAGQWLAVWILGFSSWVHLLLCCGLWDDAFTFLGLDFPSCKIGVISSALSDVHVGTLPIVP